MGAGRIGLNLAKTLSEENNEVHLIELNEEKSRRIGDKLDVITIVGNGASPEILEKAGIIDADLVLAVTTSDETNLVVCALAASFGAKRRIARVRNTSLSKRLSKIGYSSFHIDELINPELLAAQSIVKIIQAPGSSEVADFADGRILLRSFDISTASPLCGMKLEELNDEDFPWPFVVITVLRDEKNIVPRGDTTIMDKDLIYVLLPVSSLGEFLTYVDPDAKMPEKIIIHGATITGQFVAESLHNKVKNITIIEEDPETARRVAAELEGIIVVNGSGSEADILTECGIEAADAFIATSRDDHNNFISSVLAKSMGAKETIIISQKQDYLPIINALDIDAIINPHTLAIEQILHLVRGGRISSVAKLFECDAEAIELIPEEGSAVTKDLIRNIKFPKNTVVGAVYGKDHLDLAKGDMQIKAGEKVIIFSHAESIKKLQELFTR